MPASLLPAASASGCPPACTPPGRGARDHRASLAKTLVEGDPSAEGSCLHSAEESGSARGGSTGCHTAGEAGRGGGAYVVCFAQMGRLRRSPVAEFSHLLFICWALRMLLSLLPSYEAPMPQLDPNPA